MRGVNKGMDDVAKDRNGICPVSRGGAWEQDYFLISPFVSAFVEQKAGDTSPPGSSL